MKTLRTLLLFIIAGSLFSCSTGKKALQKGDYANAVFKSVERLRGNPDNKNAISTLRNAYPLATSTLEVEIEDILLSNDPSKYGIAADKYQLLNDMADEIRRSPAAIKIIPNPKTYSTQLTATKDKAAEEAYSNGVRLLNEGDRLSAKDAFYEFQACLEYNPKYKDARKLMLDAKELATLKVVVEPISVPGRYKLNSDFFFNDLLTQLNNDQSFEFIQLIDSKDADRYRTIDHILSMQFFEFQVGATKDEKSEKEFTSKDSVKVGTATVNGQQVDVYNRVKATFTSNKRMVSSSGTLQVKILDAYNKKILENKVFPGSFVWQTEWASYNGDQRALSKEQLDLCQKKPEAPPAPQDLFFEFTRPIFDQTRSFLRSYYRRF
jgi:hypothetical protein